MGPPRQRNRPLVRRPGTHLRTRREPAQFDDADWDTWEQTTGQLAHGELREPHDAIHIAGMDPTLALALADWLVYEATKAALGWNGQSDRALAVADAYLGP